MTNDRIFEANIIFAFMSKYIGIDISYNSHIKITALRTFIYFIKESMKNVSLIRHIQPVTEETSYLM